VSVNIAVGFRQAGHVALIRHLAVDASEVGIPSSEMTSTRSRGATRIVAALFGLLVVVLGGRQLVGTTPQALARPVKNAFVLSASDHGVQAVASRTPVPAQEARLDLGVATPVGAMTLLMLVWTAALAVGRGRLVLDTLGVRYRRRGPPTFFAI